MSWVKARKEEARQMRIYIDQLEQRNKELIEAVSNTAIGVVDGNLPQSWNTETKVRESAARVLRKFATQPLMSRPSSWW